MTYIVYRKCLNLSFLSHVLRLCDGGGLIAHGGVCCWRLSEWPNEQI